LYNYVKILLTSAGSPHSRSQTRPESGTSMGLGMARIWMDSINATIVSNATMVFKIIVAKM
jgi:hypothetical protein